MTRRSERLRFACSRRWPSRPSSKPNRSPQSKQGSPHQFTHDNPRKSPESYWETRIDPYFALYGLIEFGQSATEIATSRCGSSDWEPSAFETGA